MSYVVHLLATAYLPFLVACASPKVVVMNVQGNPIPDALVYSVSLSMDVGPAKTNSRGEASVPSNIQGIHWVEVSKNGYKSVRVEVSGSWPLNIILKEL